MTLGWQNNQPTAGTSLNLSQTGAPLGGYNNGFATPQYSGYASPQQGWYGQQQQQPGVMGSLFAGATGQDPYNQQPMMPPSETEILMTMLDTSFSAERFLQSPAFPLILEIFSSITIFSLLSVLKDASYNFDEEDGVFTLDTTTLPSELQTMSSENILAQVTGLMSTLSRTTTDADAHRAQTLQNAQSSMLQSQLAGALADPGMMTNAAAGTGTFFRSFLTGRP